MHGATRPADCPGDTSLPRCLHHTFEQQAQATPDAVAVIFDEQSISYRELNRRANRVARRLMAAGVGPDCLVGVHLERSADMVAGLLGILKAGGAYLPLDPQYPRERLSYMLADAGAAVVLTERGLLASLPPHQATIVFLDEPDETGDPEADVNPSTSATGLHLAYVIYTSGSTGRPKGVGVVHHAVVDCLHTLRHEPGLGAEDTVLAMASIAFDMSVFEIFLPLMVGARVVVVSREAAQDGARLVEILRRSHATFGVATPTTWRLLLDAGWNGSPTMTIVSAGEALTAKLVSRLLGRGASLWNFYGPTETTIICSGARIESAAGPVPVGAPIPGASMYILDSRLEPVPGDTVGELHIGGPCVARGYLGRPGLTAEKFVPDPFSADAGARMYRSGDLARWCPDGTVEIIGRADYQVKLRGFRIELGEIEAVLEQFPLVRDAVVLLREDAAGDPQLVAYVVCHGKDQLTTSAVRDYLRARLPEHMVPGAFVHLDALPMNPNGKVDRRALPAPDRARPDLDGSALAPRSATEAVLAGIWAEVLGLEGIGVTDDFFDLGGHSLKATQVVNRVREAFQVELPVHRLFTAPTVAGLAEVIEHLGRERLSSQDAPILPVPRDGDLPLSFSQERAWFIQHLDPTSLAYNFQATLRFIGPLDVAVLERSLSEMIARHEILRTTFPAEDERPTQRVHAPWDVRLRVIDLQSFPSESREGEARRSIEEDLQTPFDVTRLPLVRWTLLRLGPEEHLLLQVEHHLVHDGWSFRIFVREMLQLYQSFAAGQPSPLAPLPVQFADVAHYQRRWMQGEEAARQLAYWRRKLGGDLPVLALPTDRPRPARQTYRGAAPRMELPAALCQGVRELSRREHTTLFMTMLSAYAVLLHRYTGQDEVCIGSGVANRRWRETERVMGMLVNNVVLRLDLSGDPSFETVLRRVREVAVEAFANEDVPFDQVVHAVQPPRDPSRNPLFQVMFSFHDAPISRVEPTGLRLELMEAVSNKSAKFDLNIIVIPRPEGITMVWEYNTDLFEAGTIARMMEHYRYLLAQAVAAPHTRQSGMSLATEVERRQLVQEWSGSASPYPRHATVHALLAEQAGRTPDAVAVSCGSQRVTYAELNRRANQLAHHLRKVGVGPGVIVGVCTERSPEMVVGLLAILKAGGAYLPLDPAYPAERLAFMLEDTGTPVILTQQRLIDLLPSTGVTVICLDTDRWTIARESEAELSGGSAEDLAYVMYTSGSTGRPKGVEIPHRAIVRLVRGTGYAEFGPGETFLQLAPIAFDASTFELWGALLHGSRCVLFSGAAPAPRELGAVLRRERVTTLWLTASLFNTVLDDAPEALAGLRQLLIGGEALSVPHVRRALEQLPTVRIINGYGPTESTTFTCCYTIPRELPPATTSIPLGRPIANTEVFVLDAYGQPVPAGVPGELYIGGDGLARGYHRRPELTAERFVPHRFRSESDARLYRTGDRVRYLPDGNLEFLGRLDDQVKLRGFRVEPGEIEAVLLRHPGLREAAVVMRDDTGDKRLVGYVVPREEPAPSVGELRAFLRSHLPEYMIPAAFVPVEALPLTPSGKLDRRALPAPEQSRPDLGQEYVAPRSPVEALLVQIYAAVLGLVSVGIHDDFFALGGHSLLATQVISRAMAALHVDVPLRAIFEAPTVAGLAQALVQRVEQSPNPPWMSITKVPRGGKSGHSDT